MAKPQEENQEEQIKQKLNEEQLAALETISGERPENVLRAAVDIGILQDETRAKIETEFPGHLLKFQAAFAKERMEGTPDKKAFVRAFKIIYGKFILEQTDPEMQNPEEVFMSTMKRVLREDSYERMWQSPAIKATASRLSMLSSDKARADVKKRINEKTKEKDVCEAQIPDLEETSVFLKDASEVLEKIDIISSIKPKADNLQKLEKKGTDLTTAMRRSTAIVIESDEIKSQLDSLETHIKYGLADDSVEQVVPGIQQKCLDFLKELKKFRKKTTTPKETADFVNKKYGIFISELRALIQAKKTENERDLSTLRNKISTLDREITDLGSFAAVTDETEIEEKIAVLKDKKSKETGRKNKRDDSIEKLSTERNQSRDQLKAISDRIAKLEEEKEKLRAYLEFYRKNLRGNENLSDYDRYENFLTNSLSLIENFKQKIFEAKTNEDLLHLILELENLRSNVETLSETENLPFTLKTLCDDYVNASLGFKKHLNRPGVKVTKDVIDEFFSDHLEKFLREFKKKLDELRPIKDFDKDKAETRISGIDADIGNLTLKKEKADIAINNIGKKIKRLRANKAASIAHIQDLDAEIDALEKSTPQQRILDKAFPVVDPVEKRKAQRAMKRAEQKVENADKAQDYFDEPDTKNAINTAYSIFTSYRRDPDLNARFEAATQAKLYSSNLTTKIRELMRGNKEEKRLADEVKAVRQKAMILQKSMEDFVNFLPVLLELGIVKQPSNSKKNPQQLISEYKRMDINGNETTLEDLDNFTKELLKYFGTIRFNELDKNFAAGISKFKEEFEKSKKEFDELDKADKKHYLTETIASKQIIKTILKEQYPDADEEELERRATLILTDDVMTIQTLDSYEKLAERGSAELFEAVQQVGVEEKLLGMELKEPGSEKIDRPFQGYKLEQLSNLSKLENLILNNPKFLENGFIVLASYEHTFAGTTDVRVIRLRKALRTALIRREFPAAEDYLYLPKLGPLIDQAFDKYLAEGRRKYNAWSNHYESNKPVWDLNLANKLNEDYERLANQHDEEEINDQMFAQRKAELLKEARDGGVHDQISFAMDSAMASHAAKWLQDFGHKRGVEAKEAGKALGMMGVDTAVGATGQVAKRGFRLGKFLGTPLWWAAKYPLIGAAKILALPRHVFNFFAPERWHIRAPFQGVGRRLKADVSKAGERGKSIFSGILSETKNGILNAIKGRWGQRKPEYKTRAERSDFDSEASEAKSKEFAELAKKTPAELPASEGVDLDEIKARIDKIIVTEVQIENAAKEERAAS